ncbi:GDP-fucose protein O-fucosyltransferase 2-like [Homalodisca vitripennis]|uniref:GDP-fucose protein O-fucosyltransferase 2-like n=1 Tax=Homalodisca vitripennis TaxID=197043 RepID=UPI001EEC4C3C|nr:GDP-fucose protein O-fucosyltransferase 2-like [Homalodisca vitripennis]XP_046677615.1 GDP-fucose protein O-fucosyltransferase 2-like [Homalodisca vitripennis]
MHLKIIILILLTLTLEAVFTEENHCSKAFGCSGNSVMGKVSRYVLYDVNIGEGFNLKRDVYMRMAMFIQAFAQKSKDDWHLVLPPWTRQWHWTTEKLHVSYQWSDFFDVASLQLYSPVIELDQFYVDWGDLVDEVYILQHFPEFYDWTEGGGGKMDWSDKWKLAECRDHPYYKKENGTFLFFRGKKHVRAKQVQCVSFQGSSAYLEAVVSSTKARCIMFDRAEIATHMMYGDANYWKCRRSMRFAKHLVDAANAFRASHLNSTDLQDGTVRPLDWRDEVPHRSAKGGPYLGVHLRRKDFIYGRPKEVPSIVDSAVQIKMYLKNLKLSTVFVATDMPTEEYESLQKLLEKDGFRSVKFVMKDEDKNRYKEGGLAIIDQIVASHARFFVGTHESTFSFRIQEEREILGFPADTTFNRFCPTPDNKNCTPPTKWLIEYPDGGNFKSVNFKHFETDEL